MNSFTFCRCGAKWQCIDSRPRGDVRVRRYRCPDCEAMRMTHETVHTTYKLKRRPE